MLYIIKCNGQEWRTANKEQLVNWMLTATEEGNDVTVTPIQEKQGILVDAILTKMADWHERDPKTFLEYVFARERTRLELFALSELREEFLVG